MLLQIRYKNLAEATKEDFNAYLEAKLERLRPRIEKHFPDPDTVELDVSIEKFEKHNAFELRLRLKLPQEQFVVQETKHGLNEVIDLAMEVLDRKVTEYFDRP